MEGVVSMKTRSGSAMTEALRTLLELREQPPLPSPDNPWAGIPDELGELFLADARNRRRRLAEWLCLLHQQARLRTALRPAARYGHRRCRCLANRRLR
jgi:hypothetical protein